MKKVHYELISLVDGSIMRTDDKEKAMRLHETNLWDAIEIEDFLESDDLIKERKR